METDAEHQQHDADLGQLARQVLIGHEARGLPAHRDAGQQIAHDRRKAQPLRDVAEHQRRGQAAGERHHQM